MPEKERISIKEFNDFLKNPREDCLVKLDRVISHAKEASLKYTYLGPSPFDDKLGEYNTNMKKYKKELEKGLKSFMDENESKIKKLGLKREVKKIILEANAFEGENIIERDPHASPGRNHHTGRPYY